jgi:hypothetical protein
MNRNAYNYLKEFVLSYIYANFETLTAKYEVFTKNDVHDIKHDRNFILEWFLGEMLDENEFKPLIVIQGWDIDKVDFHTRVYHINDKYVRVMFKNGEYLTSEAVFDFVKPVKKVVTTINYEVID